MLVSNKDCSFVLVKKTLLCDKEKLCWDLLEKSESVSDQVRSKKESVIAIKSKEIPIITKVWSFLFFCLE